MPIDRRVKEVEDFRFLKAKLSIIRYLDLNLKPYSLGVVARYIHYRKNKDDCYLRMNEYVTKLFLDYILDNNPIAIRELIADHKNLYNIANLILGKENDEITVPENELEWINLFFNYIESGDNSFLNQIRIIHEKGEVIYEYLKFIKTNSAESQVHLEYGGGRVSLTFADSLINCNQMALDSLLIKDRVTGK